MWVFGASAAYIVLSLLTPVCALADEVCKDVQRAIDAQVVDAADPRSLRRVAPFLGIGAVRTLLQRATSPSTDEAAAFDAYLAIGLTRHAEALRLVREAPRSARESTRLGHALALLALGDGTESGTISEALFEGTVTSRRRVASSLSLMKQKRPMMMLYEALEDLDEGVRYQSARVLVRAGSMRARRALVELARNKHSDLGDRSARVLARAGYNFKPDELALLPPELKTEINVSDAVRGRRSNLHLLSAQTRSPDELTRAMAHAALALSGVESMPAAKKLSLKSPPGSIGEMTMALALLGDSNALLQLPALDRASAERAVGVLYAFSAGGPSRAQLEPDHAGEIARAVEGWIVRGLLDDVKTSRAMRAMERCDPIAGLLLARTRLAGPDGLALRTAIRIIARSGSAGDASALMDVAKRSPVKTRVEAWRSAARVCRR